MNNVNPVTMSRYATADQASACTLKASARHGVTTVTDFREFPGIMVVIIKIGPGRASTSCPDGASIGFRPDRFAERGH
jgi:hypothetical protein